MIKSIRKHQHFFIEKCSMDDQKFIAQNVDMSDKLGKQNKREVYWLLSYCFVS
nr:MAG TPA: hypothetical protein [Crassvirales sp.]